MGKRVSREQGLTIYRQARQKGKREAILRKQLEEYRAWVLNQNPEVQPFILDNLVKTKRTQILREMKREARANQQD